MARMETGAGGACCGEWGHSAGVGGWYWGAVGTPSMAHSSLGEGVSGLPQAPLRRQETPVPTQHPPPRCPRRPPPLSWAAQRFQGHRAGWRGWTWGGGLQPWRCLQHPLGCRDSVLSPSLSPSPPLSPAQSLSLSLSLSLSPSHPSPIHVLVLIPVPVLSLSPPLSPSLSQSHAHSQSCSILGPPQPRHQPSTQGPELPPPPRPGWSSCTSLRHHRLHHHPDSRIRGLPGCAGATGHPVPSEPQLRRSSWLCGAARSPAPERVGSAQITGVAHSGTDARLPPAHPRTEPSVNLSSFKSFSSQNVSSVFQPRHLERARRPARHPRGGVSW